MSARESRLAPKCEARTLYSLGHPGIIRLIDKMETSSRIHLVMELAHGGDLLNYIISEGCLTETRSRQFFQELALAANYLHRTNVAHRDLKPDTLLFDAQPRSPAHL